MVEGPLEDPELEAFQAALLELLAANLTPDEVRRRALELPGAEPFRDWIEAWEPRCVETASILVRKWGHRRGGAAVARPQGS